MNSTKERRHARKSVNRHETWLLVADHGQCNGWDRVSALDYASMKQPSFSQEVSQYRRRNTSQSNGTLPYPFPSALNTSYTIITIPP